MQVDYVAHDDLHLNTDNDKSTHNVMCTLFRRLCEHTFK